MKRRVLAYSLSVMMVIGSMPAQNVFAFGSEGTVDVTTKLKYTANSEGGVTITGYEPEENEVLESLIIPETVAGKTVTAIAAGAFTDSACDSLKDVTVLGKDVVLDADCGLGYTSASQKIEGMRFWGVDESGVEAYALSKAFVASSDEFNSYIISDGVTGIHTIAEYEANAYTSMSIPVYVTVSSKSPVSKDVLWSSENDEQISIVPVEKDVTSTLNEETGLYEYTAEATATINSKGDGTCTLYAGSRGAGEKIESLTINIKQSATSLSIESEVWSSCTVDSDTGEVTEHTVKDDIIATYYTDKRFYMDKGTYLWIKPTTVGDDGDDAIFMTSAGSDKTYQKIAEYNDGIVLKMISQCPKQSSTQNLTPYDFKITTMSSKGFNYYIYVYEPATKIQVYTEESGTKTVITTSETSGTGYTTIEGSTIPLKVTFTPSGSADVVEWTSSNPSAAEISEDGVITARNQGYTTITCTVKDTLGVKRGLTASFTLSVNKRISYTTLGLSTTTSKENVITDEIKLKDGAALIVYPVELADGAEESNLYEPVVYESSDTKVATVSPDGTITALTGKSGTVTITVSTKRTNTVQTTYSIKVKVYVPATGVIGVKGFTLPKGHTKTISYSVNPSTSNEELAWFAVDSSKLSVTDNGDSSITVKALSDVGSTKIRAVGKDSGQTVNETEVVLAKAINIETLKIEPTSTDSYLEKTTVDDVDIYKVAVGQTIVFEPVINPADANDELQWEYDPTSKICTVTVGTSDTPNLSVKAAKQGEQTFILKDVTTGTTVKCQVKVVVPSTGITVLSDGSAVSEVYMSVGSSTEFKASLTPTNTDDNVTWTVDENYLEIDNTYTAKNEVVSVTAKKNVTGALGTTLTAKTDSGIEYKVNIIVNNPTNTIVVNNGTNKDIKKLVLLKGQETELTLETTNADPTVDGTDTIYEWTQNNGLVNIVVPEDGDGKTVTIKALETTGSDTIKIAAKNKPANSKGASIELVVAEPSTGVAFSTGDTVGGIVVDATETISVKQTPVTATDGVTFTVDREGIVEITPGTTTNGETTLSVKGLSAGEVNITVTTGSGKTATRKVIVTAIDLSTLTNVTVSNATGEASYTGLPIEKSTVSVKAGTSTLVKGTDYEVSYEDNINAGTAKVIITGIGKYTGSITKEFKIKAISGTSATKVFKDTKSSSKITRAYNGLPYKPEVVLSKGDIILVNGTDYDLVYPAACTSVGTYKITIKFKGNYTGSTTMSYGVTAKDISTGAGIAVSGINASGYTYTGNAIKPVPIIKDGAKVLVKGADFTLSYTNYTNASTTTNPAKITITGKGNYKGTRTVNYKINPISMSKVTVAPVAAQKYTGREIKPSLKVSYGTKSVTYTASYSNNVNTGVATVKLTGKGNYAGVKTVTFKILPSNVSGVTQSKATNTSVTLKWNKAAGKVTGYRVYLVSNNKYKKVAETNKTSVTIKKLKAGKKYTYVVAAYNKLSGQGAYSSVVTAMTSAKAPTSVKVVSKTSKAATVTWKAATSASKYAIYTSTNNNSFKLKGTTSGTSYNLSGLKGGKKIYVKIKSIKTINGKDYASSYSKVSSVKVKK